MTSAWSQNQISALIQLYQQNPCLYVVKSPLYHNKRARTVVLKEICEELSKLGLYVTVQEIKRKFNNLRTNFLAQHRKYNTSIKSGITDDEIVKPSLWYYDNMSFLLEHTIPRNSIKNDLHSLHSDEFFHKDISQLSHCSNSTDSSIQQDIKYEFSETEEEQPTTIQSISDPTDLVQCINSSEILSLTEMSPAAELNTILGTIVNNENATLRHQNSCESTENLINARGKTTKRKRTSQSENDDECSSVMHQTPNNFQDLPIDYNKCPKKSSNDVFGEFIATQLDYLEEADKKLHLQTQQDITNLIFAARRKTFQDVINND